MPVTLFGDGTLFGDADAIFGRVGSQLIAAQASSFRQTALQVLVLDEHLNDWEELLDERSTDIKVSGLGEHFYHPANGHKDPTDLGYYAYRGSCSVISTDDNRVIRVRTGTPNDVNDRQLWIQTITDPTNSTQWADAAWSVLYSGTHYGATVAKNGTGFEVIHTKSDGVYKNNVKKLDNSAFTSVDPGAQALSWIRIEGAAWWTGWVYTIRPDTYDNHRVIDYWFIRDLDDGLVYYDYTINFRHYRSSLQAINTKEGYDQDVDLPTIERLASTNYEFNPRIGDHGMALWYDIFQGENGFTDGTNPWGHAPYVIRGVGGGAGRNWMGSGPIKKFSDGFYYASGGEIHEDQSFEGATSLGSGFPIWARSKDLKHWTDWTIGPPVRNNWGSGGFVEVGGYVYWSANQVVWRRPSGTVETDISNYVPHAEFELPRDNQPATGQLLVANPDGINDNLKTLSDREIVVSPGLLVAGGTYEYATFDRFFISQINTERQGEINRLHVQFGNAWTRLDNPLRDVTNFIGKTDWEDFDVDKRNKAFNYFFKSDIKPTVDPDSFRLQTRGRVLFTGWKGQNPDVGVKFANVTGTKKARLIFRYIDDDNYCYLLANGDLLELRQLHNKNDELLDIISVTADSTPRLRIILRWNQYTVYYNGDKVMDSWFEQGFRAHAPGYVGFEASKYEVGEFHCRDWQADLTMEDLAKTALAIGDFHDVIVGNCDARAFAIIWGPQTDLNTPAAALAQVLETTKTQMIFRDGIVQIGRFNDQTVVRTIENEIISGDQINEAKRRINFAAVDGNDKFWMQIDADDLVARGRTLVGYFDLPELLDLDQVKDRALEEIKRSAMSASPGGTTPLFFDLWRMDAVNWVNQGETTLARIEGFKVVIEQGTRPSQHQEFDLGEYSTSSDSLIDDPIIDA